MELPSVGRQENTVPGTAGTPVTGTVTRSLMIAGDRGLALLEYAHGQQRVREPP